MAYQEVQNGNSLKQNVKALKYEISHFRDFEK
jgi:hypothetical protein